jgi:hypothetical protein
MELTTHICPYFSEACLVVPGFRDGAPDHQGDGLGLGQASIQQWQEVDQDADQKAEMNCKQV